MENKQLAKELITLCGGVKNIIEAENCMTRLRVAFKDRSRIKEKNRINKRCNGGCSREGN